MADARIAQLETALSALDIKVDIVRHEAVVNMEEHKKQAGHLGGELCKNLFLKSKKNPKLALVVLKADQKVDLKTLGKLCGVGSSGFRFADAEKMTAVLKCERGSVTPFSVLNDTDNQVTLIFDKNLLADDATVLNVHPLTNEATSSVTAGQLKKFIASQGNTLVEIDVDNVPEPAAQKPKKQKQPQKQKAKKVQKKGETRLGVEFKKADDFPGWYKEILTKGEMIEYYEHVSGCYILRPNSYFIWEQIQQFLDKKIKSIGVQNTYFPMFVSKKQLCAEEDHIEGFAAEVAWVTKAGKSDLAEPIAIRPTSETVMYPAFAKWIRSHRNLPLKLNQWCNVVRWEFKNPTPFIRTREFLWQEGHTAHATSEGAREEVLQVLDFYRSVYEDLLAIPVIKGEKTELEKFPGGDYTTTIEAFVPGTGRGVQSATSHGLGQHFGKIFDISFEDKNHEKAIPFQNSWGLTTRSIGVAIMVHSDDTGLVLPPRVAQFQAVVVPIVYKTSEEQQKALDDALDQVQAAAQAGGIRLHIDDRSNCTPGWKYSDWELKGVPVRLELGPRDIKAKQVVAVRRDTNKNETIAWAHLAERMPKLLDEMHDDMFQKATKERDERQSRVTDWAEFMKALNQRNSVLAPSCNEKDCEEAIKDRSAEDSAAVGDEHANDAAGDENVEQLTGAAKSLCIPFNQPAMPDNMQCVYCDCNLKAKKWILYGRSY